MQYGGETYIVKGDANSVTVTYNNIPYLFTKGENGKLQRLSNEEFLPNPSDFTNALAAHLNTEATELVANLDGAQARLQTALSTENNAMFYQYYQESNESQGCPEVGTNTIQDWLNSNWASNISVGKEGQAEGKLMLSSGWFGSTTEAVLKQGDLARLSSTQNAQPTVPQTMFPQDQVIDAASKVAASRMIKDLDKANAKWIWEDICCCSGAGVDKENEIRR